MVPVRLAGRSANCITKSGFFTSSAIAVTATGVTSVDVVNVVSERSRTAGGGADNQWEEGPEAQPATRTRPPPHSRARANRPAVHAGAEARRNSGSVVFIPQQYVRRGPGAMGCTTQRPALRRCGHVERAGASGEVRRRQPARRCRRSEPATAAVVAIPKEDCCGMRAVGRGFRRHVVLGSPLDQTALESPAGLAYVLLRLAPGNAAGAGRPRECGMRYVSAGDTRYCCQRGRNACLRGPVVQPRVAAAP